MLKNFYEKDQKEIRGLLIDFLNTDFYSTFPMLKGIVSIIVTGSVAYGRFDKYSDIDLKIIFQTKELADEHKVSFKEYKKHLEQLSIPVQLHTSAVYTDIDNALSTWDDDDMLREMSQALIIEDPYNTFHILQEKYAQYPEGVRKEKLKWLFSEIILQIEDRWKVAQGRNDIYYCSIIKMQIIRLACNTLLLLNKKYPSYDKHLYQDVSSLNETSLSFLPIVDSILLESNLPKIAMQLNDIVIFIEDTLIEKGIVTKESREYWLGFRTSYTVKLT